MPLNRFDQLVDQLDLQGHITAFEHFLSRPKPLYIEGDQGRHFRYIRALDALEFPAPPKVADCTPMRMHLKKKGVLSFAQIFEIVKMVRYFRTLDIRSYEGIIGEWMAEINVPEKFSEVNRHFDDKGEFNESLDDDLFRVSERIRAQKSDLSAQLKRTLHSDKLADYLVDTQVHFTNDEECLLLRPGFAAALGGSIVGRTTAGFFYVVPDSVTKARETIRSLSQERDALLYRHAKRLSKMLEELQSFIRFIDREFDRLDHYQARVLFARDKGLAIMSAVRGDKLVLDGFQHPALHKPKPVSLDFSAGVLMITGVNAGGKTMLLKSILSAALMAKYLLPMKINAHRSSIGTFKHVEAVIDDPQNVKNDISTFAGRMQQFAHLFEHREALIGVDEIELGTDSDEAAALFKVILEELVSRGQKIVVTTHHKRLASLMADRKDVELMAAVYDEAQQLPTYEFLQGIIGKSYAFETALRYGISHGIVTRARETFGEQYEKLNLLIERGSQLERDLRQKHDRLDEKLASVKEQELLIKEERDGLRRAFEKERDSLRAEYETAIKAAKEAAKAGDMAAIHRAMNEANKKLPKAPEPPVKPKPVEFKIGDTVKYRKERGTIVGLKAKEAIIEVEGIRLHVRRSELKLAGQVPKPPKPKVEVSRNVEARSGLRLDLHGMRAEEANEALDRFISDALIQGWDEVLVYHGIGTGKLSYAVKEFLKAHPKVKGFEDAPQQMGGFGAKVVRL